MLLARRRALKTAPVLELGVAKEELGKAIGTYGYPSLSLQGLVDLSRQAIAS